MKFTVQQHQKKDFYETFCKWLAGHNFPEINQQILPENVFVCYEDDVPIYCIWVYFTDSKLCWIAWPASNKNVNYKRKENGLRFLMETVSKYCKKKKIQIILTTSGTESIIEPLLKSGFEIGDTGINHYTKRL